MSLFKRASAFLIIGLRQPQRGLRSYMLHCCLVHNYYFKCINMLLILTPFIWKDTIYLMCRIFGKVRNSILPLCLLTLFMFYTLTTSLKLSCTSGYGISPQSQKHSYMEIRSSKPCERSSFGLLDFIPKHIKFYMMLRLSTSNEWYCFGLLVFTPK